MEQRGRQGVLVALATAVLVAGATVVGAPVAGAGIGPFHVQPSSGPPGTSVNVHGSGCDPGVVRNSQDYVSVSSSTYPVNVHVPVNSGGSWSMNFTVPAGTIPSAALITASCFTNSLPSLWTIYEPSQFFVTAGSAPPPVTTPPVTVPTSTPPVTVTPAGEPGATPVGSATGGGTAGTTAAPTSGTRARVEQLSPLDRREPSHRRVQSRRDRETIRARRGPALARLVSDNDAAPGGIGWGWWLLFALVVVGLVGTWAWMRWRHSTGPPAASGPDDAAQVEHVEDVPVSAP